MTFAATANAVLYVGAEPRFADVDPGSLLIEPSAVAAAITERTRAILPVDYAGQPADYVALRAIADAAPGGPLTIIADASHSLGATFERRPVGTLADLTVLSLHPAKILTTGEGGAVLTDRDDLAAALRRFRNHGIDDRARGAPRLDLRHGRARLQLPADRHRRRRSARPSSTGSRSSSPGDASSRLHYLERLAGHRALGPAGRRPAGGPGLALRVRPAPAGPAARRPRGRSTTRSVPRGSGSTSTTSPSISIRSIASAIPACRCRSPRPPTSGC